MKRPLTLNERPIWTPTKRQIKAEARRMGIDLAGFKRKDLRRIVALYRQELEWCLYTNSYPILDAAIKEIAGQGLVQMHEGPQQDTGRRFWRGFLASIESLDNYYKLIAICVAAEARMARLRNQAERQGRSALPLCEAPARISFKKRAFISPAGRGETRPEIARGDEM